MSLVEEETRDGRPRVERAGPEQRHVPRVQRVDALRAVLQAGDHLVAEYEGCCAMTMAAAAATIAEAGEVPSLVS